MKTLNNRHKFSKFSHF